MTFQVPAWFLGSSGKFGLQRASGPGTRNPDPEPGT
jgi:hypothetical protein